MFKNKNKFPRYCQQTSLYVSFARIKDMCPGLNQSLATMRPPRWAWASQEGLSELGMEPFFSTSLEESEYLCKTRALGTGRI